VNNQWNIEDSEEGCQGFFVAFFCSFFVFFFKKSIFLKNIKVNILKYFVSIFLGTDFLSVEYN